MMSADRYVTLINLALLTLAVFFGVRAFYDIVQARLDHLPAPAPLEIAEHLDAQSERGRIRPYTDYQAIDTRDLFRLKPALEKHQGAQEQTIDPDELETTDLDLTLWGTVAGLQSVSYAIIEDRKDRKQDVYGIGDTIQSAVVKMVLPKKVVLTVDGEDQILQMENEQTATASRPSRAPADIFGRTPAAIGAAAAQKRTLKRSMINEALSDVSTLMRQVQIRPHFVNGRSDGLIMSGIRPNSIFRYMGFRNGDIITGINGRKIESVDDALQFYDNLRSADSTRVQYKRRGRDQTIEITID